MSNTQDHDLGFCFSCCQNCTPLNLPVLVRRISTGMLLLEIKDISDISDLPDIPCPDELPG